MMNRQLLNRISNHVLWPLLNAVGLTKKRMAQLLGRTRLTTDQIRLLAEMRELNSLSRSPFRATEIWVQISRKFDDWFWWEGIADVETQEMNEWFSAPRPGNPKLLQYACWMYYKLLKERDKYNLLSKIPATADSKSGAVFYFDRATVSWDQLISIDTLYSMAEGNPSLLSKPVVVLDLGAGWGRMGYVLKKANPLSTYIICDLPEALLVSSSYLPRILPQEKFHSFLDTRVGNLDSQCLRNEGVSFLATQDLDRIPDKSIDFFINVASFQEMTREQVGYYFELIDRKVKGVFFTQQLWSARTHSFNFGEISGFEEYPFPLHWNSLYLRNATFSNYYFETAYRID